MVRMIDRFVGEAGRSNLVEVLCEHTIMGRNRDLAELFADHLELISVDAGETLIEQGAEDNDLFLIISGSFGILVNGLRVATRGPGDHIGEMALIEPTQRRAASALSDEPSIVAKVAFNDAFNLAEKYPEIYRHISKSLSRRLRERNRLVGQFRDRTKVFIISSVEALPIARIIQSSFEHDPFLTTLWTDGVFRATSYALESLESAVDDTDFAIAVAHGDDLAQFRGKEWPSPRDNVIFELGLFMGKLGRKRAILMEPREDRVRLPSDLSGVTTIPYRYEAGKDASALLAPACNRLREHINEWGPFNG